MPLLYSQTGTVKLFTLQIRHMVFFTASLVQSFIWFSSSMSHSPDDPHSSQNDVYLSFIYAGCSANLPTFIMLTAGYWKMDVNHCLWGTECPARKYSNISSPSRSSQKNVEEPQTMFSLVHLHCFNLPKATITTVIFQSCIFCSKQLITAIHDLSASSATCHVSLSIYQCWEKTISNASTIRKPLLQFFLILTLLPIIRSNTTIRVSRVSLGQLPSQVWLWWTSFQMWMR